MVAPEEIADRVNLERRSVEAVHQVFLDVVKKNVVDDDDIFTS